MRLKLIFIVILTLLTCNIIHAKTYYYKLEKIITNQKHQLASGSGIFITFTSNGCYDGDCNGYTNNNSYLKLAYQGKYITYNGDTYWGKGDYKFTSDYSRLNIVVDNKVYVYNRTTKPSNISQSTYVGHKKQLSGNSSGHYSAPNIGESYPSNSSNECMSQAWYQETYNRYADVAQIIYNSITTKFRDNNGNEVSGYVYRQEDNQIVISEMKRNLRNVQCDMRDLRQEATRKGYSISKSTYEDITVNTF